MTTYIITKNRLNRIKLLERKSLDITTALNKNRYIKTNNKIKLLNKYKATFLKIILEKNKIKIKIALKIRIKFPFSEKNK
jgi:hypothetical protein